MKRVAVGDKGQSIAEMRGPRAGMMWGPETSLGRGENKFTLTSRFGIGNPS